MIQAMEILQLSIMALQERIDAELESNPVLEMRDDGVDEQAPPAVDESSGDRGEQAMVVQDKGDATDDFQRLDDFSNEYGQDLGDYGPAVSSDGERDRKMDAMANAPAPAISLDEHLLQQWMFIEAGTEVKAAGELIIQNITEDGYLRLPLEEVARQVEPPMAIEPLRNALALVKTLEPLGVGAADLKECLLIQLNAQAAAGKDVSLQTELVWHHLRDVEMNRLPQIARRTGKTLDEINLAIEEISHLNPRPGLLVGEHTAPTITPDVIVELDDQGELIVTMPDGNVPHMYISKAYRKMARDRAVEKKARQFVQRNIRSAQWLMSAIAQRQHTVRRVVEEVFAVQRDFLEQGTEALKPLPMSDVAAKVGVHVATVSRAVAGKYVQTPQGIYPLRMFFSGGKTTSAGADVAWDAIKVKLKEVIDAEDKANPLNDDEIVIEMAKHGITMARRTVAKYRDLMGIAPGRKRRQY